MSTTLKNLYNESKIGTLIVSYYRSGGHFLHDYLVDSITNSVALGEINELSVLTSCNIKTNYYVGILHSIHPKFYLLNDTKLLNKWHVVHLTRRDKVSHFISNYFWKIINHKLNTNGSNFDHHATTYTNYRNYIDNQPKVVYDIEHAKVWLLEHTLSYFIKSNYQIDYSELTSLESHEIKWNPNKYGNITLEDLFINHDELNNLLTNFVI